jgi:nitronate monooxygenase
MGYAETSADVIGEDVAKLRLLTDRPFNLNFFAHRSPVNDPVVVDATRRRLEPFYNNAGLSRVPEDLSKPLMTFTEEKLALLLEVKPSVVSFHFGLPDRQTLDALKAVGCRILCTATTTAEAVELDRARVDVIIAQGWEAGGHRGSFSVNHEDHGVGTMALVP